MVVMRCIGKTQSSIPLGLSPEWNSPTTRSSPFVRAPTPSPPSADLVHDPSAGSQSACTAALAARTGLAGTAEDGGPLLRSGGSPHTRSGC
jgi:hypothetical protein